MTTALELDELRAWIGRRESRSEILSVHPASLLAATLDGNPAEFGPGHELPPLYQWLYFLTPVRQSEIGVDGHPQRGGFLPPIPLPRRMWAASDLRFHQALKLGEEATRSSEIVDIFLKQGRSGSLVFVKLRHMIENADRQLAIEELQQLVYRDHPRSDGLEAEPAGTAAPDDALWERQLQADPVLLFRYSALTFNSHRIHYDRRYAATVEHYPALVVHGPLIATLLLDELLRRLPNRRVSRFEFRAVKPLFDNRPSFLCGRPEPDGSSVRLWSRDADGALCTDARAWIT